MYIYDTIIRRVATSRLRQKYIADDAVLDMMAFFYINVWANYRLMGRVLSEGILE